MAFLAPQFASAEPVCRPTDLLEKFLEQKYDEKQIGFGTEINGKALVRIFANEDGTTFSLVVTGPIMSCLLLGGEGWKATIPQWGEGL